MSTTKSEAASRSSTGIEVPEGMPLTNRLDKMTVEQAIWAIRNGDAWLAYLKAKGGEIYPPVVLEQPIEVSDADK